MGETTTERVIERTLEFDAAIERVWKAITDPAELSRWFGHRAELELRPGAEGALEWDEHGRFALRVEEVDQPRRLVWSWVHEPNVPFDAAPSTRVEWTLTERPDGGTTLHLRESGFQSEVHHRQNTEGWRDELGELETLLAA